MLPWWWSRPVVQHVDRKRKMNLPSGSSQRFLVQIWLTYFFFFPTVTIIWVLSENWTINFMFRWSKINQDHRIIYTELCIVTCKYSSVCNYNVQGSYCLSLKIGRKKKISATQLKKLKILSFSFENILINIVFTYSHWSLQTPLYLPHILYTLIH